MAIQDGLTIAKIKETDHETITEVEIKGGIAIGM